MHKYFLAVIIAITFLFYNSSCNRQTATNEETTSQTETKEMVPEITPDDPFKNQPNELCTIIRKLEITYYDPKKSVEDPLQYPQKYCLIDICLDDPDNNSGIVNIGDSIEPINTIFQLVKVFDTEEEARAYSAKYGVKDIQ
ncbi:MAG: hypothetical protein H7Y00_02630 [Fimbriimonadaceae bacterium]|nr:hypothetical protein [Chitinophagales bacterium]